MTLLTTWIKSQDEACWGFLKTRLGVSMTVNRTHNYLICLGLTLLLPMTASAEKLAEIPVKKFRMSRRAISLSHLSDIHARQIVANGNNALINCGRSIWSLVASTGKLEEKKVSALDSSSTWYGPVCAIEDGFLIAVQGYPEEQRRKEESSSRGDFRAGPIPKGFLILSPYSPDRYVNTLEVASRPQSDYRKAIEDTGREPFSGHVQSCASDGERIVIASYGSMGKADLKAGTIDLIDEDEGLAFNRFPLLVEASAIWVGLDEGGLGGATLEMRPSIGKAKEYGISTEEDDDVVSFTALLRHQGKLVVGTSHGLFSLDEQSERFWRFDFGKQLANLPVTTLLSHNGFLWVFMGKEWLRVDVRSRRAVRYFDSRSTPLTIGVPFGDVWFLSGPSGLWKCSLRHAGSQMSSHSIHRTRTKNPADW